MIVRSFTKREHRLVDVLFSPIRVSVCSASGSPDFKEFTGLWDTGATVSVVTQRVVDALGLAPIDFVTVFHAQGSAPNTEVYRVDFMLKNGVSVPGLRVTKGYLVGFDVLIGMDVIGKGDFAVSNFEGETVFTFRAPSVAHLDFTGKINAKPALE
jgi:predicted aspartyl protease